MDDFMKRIQKESKKLIPAPLKETLKKTRQAVKAPVNDAYNFILNKTDPLTEKSAKFVAHRGVSALAPENTVKAFKLAARGGFCAIETDVRRTKDHKLVLMHDDSLKRMCGVDRPVSDFTLEELSRIPVTGGKGVKDPDLYIPMLSEYLLICRDSGKVPMIELKDNWNVEEALPDDYLLDVVRQTADVMGERPVIYVSFNRNSLQRMKKIFSEENVKHADLYHLVKAIDEKKLPWYKKNGIGLSFKGKDNKPPVIRKAKKAGIPLVVWVVDDPKKVREYIKEGVKWIASNGYVWEK